jgi:hypothetical protein
MQGEVNMLSVDIPFSSLEVEGAYQASKWLDAQLLISPAEMSRLLEATSDLSLFITSAPTDLDSGQVSHADFLGVYTCYVEALKSGVVPKDPYTRAIFSISAALSDSASACFYRIPIGENRQLFKLRRPAIQFQPHSFSVSTADGKVRPMIQGSNTISWGIQISYPQYFQDPITTEIYRIDDSPAFPNSEPFKRIQKWIRHHTLPTPLIVNGIKQNSSIRIGGDLFSWINQHPDLIRQGLQIHTNEISF